MQASTLLAFAHIALVAIVTAGPTMPLAVPWLDRCCGAALLLLSGSLLLMWRSNA